MSTLQGKRNNLVWGNKNDRSPKELKWLLQHIIKKVRERYTDTPIFVIEITHVPVLEHLIKEINAAKEALKKVCMQNANVYWIPTKQIYLTEDGKVNRSLFGEDNIHQNREGYGRWTQLIREGIKEHLQD